LRRDREDLIATNSIRLTIVAEYRRDGLKVHPQPSVSGVVVMLVIESLHVCDHIFVVTTTSRGPGILAGIPMAKVTETREPSKRPRCPHCGDARIALMKASDPHGRNVWWLTCHVCGHMWQPVVSSIPARAVVCD
jgi:hypothetical protein